MTVLAVIFGISTVLFFARPVLQAARTSPAETAPAAAAPAAETAAPDSSGQPVPPALPSASTVPSPTELGSGPALRPAEQPADAVKPVKTGPLLPAAEKKPAAEKPAAEKLPDGKLPSVRSVSTKTAAEKVPSVRSTTGRTSPEKPRVHAQPASSPPPEKPVPVRHRGTLVFVFDDAGHNLKQLDPFLRLPFPCTIAVLPGLQYSGEAAARCRAAGKEVILHQPMQALNPKFDPGPGAITGGLKPDEIRRIVRRNLAELGPVAGLNNHEGSLITADRTAMGAVLDVVREKGIYFLDSRTNADTVVPPLARERSMTIWERAVFLDNSQDRSAIIEAVYSGMKIAERKGAAVMIGHIWSNDLADILNGMYPELSAQGFSLSTIATIATSGEPEE